MRHVGGNRLALVQYLANSSSRDAQQTRDLILRQSRCRQDILAQSLAGMRRSSLSVVSIVIYSVANQLSSSTIFDQFQCVDGVNALKHAELMRKANEVVSFIPTSEPFISGIEHHRANARLP